MRAVTRADAWRDCEFACPVCETAQRLPDSPGFTVSWVHETDADGGARRAQDLRDGLSKVVIPSLPDGQGGGNPSGRSRLDVNRTGSHRVPGRRHSAFLNRTSQPVG